MDDAGRRGEQVLVGRGSAGVGGEVLSQAGTNEGGGAAEWNAWTICGLRTFH